MKHSPLSPVLNVLAILGAFAMFSLISVVDDWFDDRADSQPSEGSWLLSDIAIGGGLVLYIAASAVFA